MKLSVSIGIPRLSFSRPELLSAAEVSYFARWTGCLRLLIMILDYPGGYRVTALILTFMQLGGESERRRQRQQAISCHREFRLRYLVFLPSSKIYGALQRYSRRGSWHTRRYYRGTPIPCLYSKPPHFFFFLFNMNFYLLSAYTIA